MIDSLLATKDGIDAVLKDSKHADLAMSASEWRFLAAFHEVLKLPANITNEMSGSLYPTASIIMPLFSSLVKQLD